MRPSALPVAIRLPSCDTATAVTGAEWPARSASCLPALASQTRAAHPGPAVTTRSPLRRTAGVVRSGSSGGVWWKAGRMESPLGVSQAAGRSWPSDPRVQPNRILPSCENRRCLISPTARNRVSPSRSTAPGGKGSAEAKLATEMTKVRAKPHIHTLRETAEDSEGAEIVREELVTVQPEE